MDPRLPLDSKESTPRPARVANRAANRAAASTLASKPSWDPAAPRSAPTPADVNEVLAVAAHSAHSARVPTSGQFDAEAHARDAQKFLRSTSSARGKASLRDAENAGRRTWGTESE